MVDADRRLRARRCDVRKAQRGDCADALSIIFSSDRPGTLGSGDLWLATRGTTAAPFGTPVNVMQLNSSDYDADPWISGDLQHVVFTRNTGGNYDIYEAFR